MDSSCPVHGRQPLPCIHCQHLKAHILAQVALNPRVHFEGTGYANGSLIFHFSCPRKHSWIQLHSRIEQIHCPYCFPAAMCHDAGLFPHPFSPSHHPPLTSPQNDPHFRPSPPQFHTFTFRFVFPNGPPHGENIALDYCQKRPSFFREEGSTPYTEQERKEAVEMVHQHKSRPACCLCLDKSECEKAEVRTKHFRRLALLIHPDKAKNIPGSSDAFVILNEAYQTLQKMFG